MNITTRRLLFIASIGLTTGGLLFSSLWIGGIGIVLTLLITFPTGDLKEREKDKEVTPGSKDFCQL
ncbi:hypothetical protein BREVNS_0257 [Brevinematales bacterium NS]|nr:hypothetical protein BREVNS_0257 [Brevinematales bacterium NS]